MDKFVLCRRHQCVTDLWRHAPLFYVAAQELYEALGWKQDAEFYEYGLSL